MHGRHRSLRIARLEHLTALRGVPKAATEDRLCGRRPEANEHERTDQLDLALEPGQARADLSRVGLLVETALALLGPLEVLDHVAHVRGVAIDTGLGERT